MGDGAGVADISFDIPTIYYYLSVYEERFLYPGRRLSAFEVC